MTLVMVTGGRDFGDRELVREVLATVLDEVGTFELMHGTARGADTISGEIARELGQAVRECPADWEPGGVFDRGAGHKRNLFMVNQGPDLVVAFPGGRGTANAVKETRRAGYLEVRAHAWHALGVRLFWREDHVTAESESL